MGCGKGNSNGNVDGGECPRAVFPYVAPEDITCDPAAIYVVHISSAAPRNAIEDCCMTITDEAGRMLMDHYVLYRQYGSTPGGLKAGCAGGITPADVGKLLYMTSDTTGSLRFQVEATDVSLAVVQSGETDLVPAQTYPPEILAELRMTLVP
jgi:hypothetical protein